MTPNASPSELPSFADARERAAWIRETVIRLSFEARSAHLGSSLSCVEIIDAILTAGSFATDPAKSRRDRLIVSKGHAAMAFYAAMAAHGLLEPALLRGYLSDGSALWGHVTMSDRVPRIDASSGSLGHGLGLACGHAYGDRLRHATRRCYVVLSDGECDEGTTWEAASFAGHHRLATVAAVIDYNKIQSLDRCEAVLTKEPFAERWRAFGWDVTECEGHDTDALMQALRAGGERPLVIIAHTVKGRGIARIEDTVASHYKPALAEDVGAQRP